jgi:hypothetical protein
MRYSLLLAFAIAVLLATEVYSGDQIDWRPVKPSELAMKTPMVEPDADAEAIFWYTWIDDKGEGIKLNHYVRVKIFTDRGREQYSKFDIPFGPGIKIKELAARVIKQDGSIIEIGDKDIFDRELIKAGGIKIKAKSFAVPSIEPGVIVEYKYREIREFGGSVGMRLAFQRDVPVEELAYYYKPNSKEPVYQAYNFTDAKFVKDTDGFFVARRINVPAFKEEPFMPPEDMVRPWMLLMGDQVLRFNDFGLSFSLTIKDESQDPSKYWSGVAGLLASYTASMNLPDSEVEKTAKSITAEAASADEKVRRIYDFCQKEIRNISYDKTLTDEEREKLKFFNGIDDVLKRKAGTSFLIDKLFGSLVHSLGFETRWTYSGNRSEMNFIPEMTNERFLHRAAVAVDVGGELKYFKPGSPFLPYGSLYWYEDGQYALLVGEKAYSWKQIPYASYDASSTKRSGKLRLLEDGTLEGELRIEYAGHPATQYRLYNYDETDEKRQELLKGEIKNRISAAEVSEPKIENVMDPNKPVVESYKVRIPGYAQKTGKRLFFQPGFFEYGLGALFSSSSRKYDIRFRYPWSENDTIDIELPKGYSLDSADTPGLLSDPNKIGSDDIRMTINKNTNVLGYYRKFYFGGGDSIDFPVTSYAPLKKLFDVMHDADNHMISIKQN